MIQRAASRRATFMSVVRYRLILAGRATEISLRELITHVDSIVPEPSALAL